MSKTILIVGGTGHQGKPVARKLQKDGFIVRIYSRDIIRAREKLGDSFEYFQGDVLDLDALTRASKGCNGLHINLNSSTLREMQKVEFEGTLNCVRAGKANDLSRITLISGAGVRRDNLWSPTIKIKWRCEEEIRNSGIPYTIFAPTYFMNGLPAYIKGDRAMIMGKQTRKIRWLSVDDYAELVSKAYASQKAVNKKFLIYGPRSHSLEEALSLYCRKKFPDVSLYKTSLTTFRFMAKISRNSDLRYVASLMNSISKVDDSGDMSETELILGKPTTGLDEWVASL